MPTTSPPTDYNYASPQIGVEIWPHNGGPIYLNGDKAGILAAMISKNIRDKDGGKFVLQIAPGGINGVDDITTWTSILTPASLVIIYLSRGSSRRIVMIGILNSVEESQVWNNKQVTRTIKIQGCDFTYFFNAFSYYTLTLLGFQPLEAAPAAGWAIGRFKGNFYGTPDSVAVDWLNVMLGITSTTPQYAVLGNTYITYKGNQIFLRDFFAYWFEAFIEAQLVYCPLYADYFNSEGSWIDRFLAQLTWPYYEFFVTTANEQDYPAISNIQKGGFGNTFGYARAPLQPITVNGYSTTWPTIVGRVNPLPWVVYNDKGVPVSAPQRDRWDTLPTFDLGSFSFIDSTVQYNANDTYNFFGVNTVTTNAYAEKAGLSSGSNGNMFGIELLGAILDRYGINTYGYRPYINQIRWLTLPPQSITKTPVSFNISDIANVLLGKLASYYIPTPNLLEGRVTIPMWPDITPGNKFIYNPFKNNLNYEFYIEGVTHSYVYGGRSTTILDLGRGALQSDYNDSNILTGMLTDGYTRVGGILTPRTDVVTVPPAYHIKLGEATSAPFGATPYYDSPPNVVPNANPSPPAVGWPAGTNNAYDTFFQDAVMGTTCNGSLDWRLVKALGMSESYITLQQSAVNGTSVGVMQVNVPAHPEYNPAELKASAEYNINAGTHIFCQEIQSHPGNLLEALAAYKGFADRGGYANPKAKSSVDLVIKYATGAGVPNLP